MHKIFRAAVAATAVLALGACNMSTSSDTAGGKSHHKANHSGKSSSSSPQFTVAQKNAIQSAQNYLAIGTGFSRAGLIGQLTSKAGSGFKLADSVFAVNHIKVDWNKQAVIAAKNYLNIGTGFSRTGLIQQLTSRAGSQFTLAQATYAANHVGL
ncbi:Ltp family lipoprotein [Nocardioides cynanchi]|uniref:Ltp family lipoprotein n=1 Tax=Nocardioides cynanchi TaxID=2558918 RepID=UPI001246E9F6|nr:Ltp family lipoprotein [Nocardioides cynanchi]